MMTELKLVTRVRELRFIDEVSQAMLDLMNAHPDFACVEATFEGTDFYVIKGDDLETIRRRYDQARCRRLYPPLSKRLLRQW